MDERDWENSTDPTQMLELVRETASDRKLRLFAIGFTKRRPNQVKKTVVGSGHAEKQQIRLMIGVLLPKADPKTEDAADALAVAICHAHSRTIRVYAA